MHVTQFSDQSYDSSSQKNLFKCCLALSVEVVELHAISSIALSACCSENHWISNFWAWWMRKQSATCIWAQSSSELPAPLGEFAPPAPLPPSSTWASHVNESKFTKIFGFKTFGFCKKLPSFRGYYQLHWIGQKRKNQKENISLQLW